jgi:nitroimidazol reductase NimA-like FMN-containing flavoprotein (pyridoxamine 5'-phosphate oxidase superfamily)
MLEAIKELIQSRDVCVLSTVSDGAPHCSLMSYVADDRCREIYMLTLSGTRKYRNLAGNSAVSLLIDNREEGRGGGRNIQALTISGVFREINAPVEAALIRRRLLERHPQLAELIAGGETRVFAVRATAFQLLDGLRRAHIELLD